MEKFPKLGAMEVVDELFTALVEFTPITGMAPTLVVEPQF